MDINNNAIIGHIAGLTDTSKKELYNILKTSNLTSVIEIVDVDIITNKIIDDKNYIEKINKLEINYKNINDEIIKYYNSNIKNDEKFPPTSSLGNMCISLFFL